MYVRDTSRILASRLVEPRGFMQIVIGPRQTGKTTAVKQAVRATGLTCRFASADPTSPTASGWWTT